MDSGSEVAAPAAENEAVKVEMSRMDDVESNDFGEDESGLVGVSSSSKPTPMLVQAVGFFFKYLLAPIYLFVVVIGSFASQEPSTFPIVNGTDGCPNVESPGSVPAGWKLALSLTPFIIVTIGILALELSSTIVAPFSLFLTLVFGFWFFNDVGVLSNFDYVTASGIVYIQIYERVLWTVFDYAFNVLAAFVFLEVLERWGVLKTMEIEFERLADDTMKKVLLVLFIFAIMIALVAPGGSNFLIAGVILIRMNIMKSNSKEEKLKYDVRIAAICLFGNGITSAFNLLGVCIIAIAEDIAPLVEAENRHAPCNIGDIVCATKQIGFHFSLQFYVFAIASPFIMAWLFSKSLNEDFKRNIVLMLGVGVFYGAAQVGTAYGLGPELPCLTSALAALLWYMTFLFLPRRCSGRKDDEKESLSWKEAFNRHSYLLPFVLLMVLLLLIRIVPKLEFYLKGGVNATARRVLNPMILDIVVFCGKWQRSFPWLAHSGMIVLWSAVLTPFMVPFRAGELTRDKKHHDHDHEMLEAVTFWQRYVNILHTSFREAVKESMPILVSIASYAAIARVMMLFSMTNTIAEALVSALGKSAFALLSPVIGFLGSFLSGSTTTSSLLFGTLQVQTAIDLDMKASSWAVAGVQILGASAGEIVSPLNAVFSTVLLRGAVPESDIIKAVLPVFAVWMAACLVVSYVALIAFEDMY